MDKRAMWKRACAVAVRLHDRGAVHRLSGKYVTMPPRNVVPSRARSRTRRCGSRAAAATPSTWPRSTGIGRSRSRSSIEEARYWIDDYYGRSTRDGVPIGDAGQPQPSRA
jgi:hypothetical protein